MVRADRREYYRKWYKKNKEDLRRKRKFRYQTDPEYKQLVKDISRRYKQRVRGERGGRALRVYRGTEHLAWPIGKLVDAGVTLPLTRLRSLEQTGRIPKPVFDGSQRAYSDHQAYLLKLYAECLEKQGNNKSTPQRAVLERRMKVEWLRGLAE